MPSFEDPPDLKKSVNKKEIISKDDPLSLRWKGRGDKRLTREQEADLATRAQAGDKEAREEFIIANLGLVYNMVRFFKIRGDHLNDEDLVQEGILGLDQAVSKFDPKKGYKFSTYATHWIRQGILRSIQNEGRTIRVPVHVGDKMRKYARAYQQIKNETGDRPKDADIAKRMNVSARSLGNLLKNRIEEPLSLDASIGEGDFSLNDAVPDVNAISPEDAIITSDLKEKILKLLHILSAKEKRVLELHFGLNGNDPLPLDDIGKELGKEELGGKEVTRQRVKQIEENALKKIRRHLRYKEDLAKEIQP